MPLTGSRHMNVPRAVRFSESAPSPSEGCRANAPLEPIGDNDLLAVAIVGGALGLDRQDNVVDGHLNAVPGQGPWPGETDVRQLQLPDNPSGDHGRLPPVTRGTLAAVGG